MSGVCPVCGGPSHFVVRVESADLEIYAKGVKVDPVLLGWDMSALPERWEFAGPCMCPLGTETD